MFKSKPLKLTNRELDILEILWNTGNDMTASQIVAASEGVLTTNTVQAVLKKLLKLELIRVANIVHSGTVLCRSYEPTIAAREQVLEQFSNEFMRFQKKITPSSLLACLIAKEKDEHIRDKEIQQLETFLDEYKKH